MMQPVKDERAWAEVDLGAIVYNYRQACALAPGSIAMPVIKANAYGHGAVQAGRALAAAGARHFAVATADEALELRAAGLNGPILVLGMAPQGRVRELARAGVAVCAGSLASAKGYAAALAGETLRVHIKLDTGMARSGLCPANAVEQAMEIAALPGIAPEGLFTHFAVADERGQDSFTDEQYAEYKLIADALGAKGLRLIRHCANSGAVLRRPDTHEEMVRPGIMLYGYPPGPDAAQTPLKAAMALRARIICLRELGPGEPVGYGLTWRAKRQSRIAVVSLGYADGLLRTGSGKIRMLVRGEAAPQVGRICMDMCMLDVTDIEGVQAGDTATVFGADGGAYIGADEYAAACGTISYEALCAVSARVPRYYKESKT